LVTQYQTQQDSIAGVSLDEEMADIIKYQHTYQASARIITTTNLMLDTLLNM
jgi:flagellar hook-associated protein 1 FlgK